MNEAINTAKPLDVMESDLKQLGADVAKLMKQFEEKYGEDLLSPPAIQRWNGSNAAYGPIHRVTFQVNFSA